MRWSSVTTSARRLGAVHRFWNAAGMRLRTLPAIVPVVGLVLAGCGGSGDTTSSVDLDSASVSDSVTIESPGRVYEPDGFVISGPTEITYRNTSGEFHDFQIEGEDFALQAPSGNEDTDVLDLPPGDYVFFCSIPGHRPAGMEGVFRVVP